MAWHEMYMARYLGVDVGALTTWVGVPAKETAQAFGKSTVDLDKAVAYADLMTGETGVFTDYPAGGTITDVLNWVNDDLDRAQYALDQENASDSPRTTLIAQLENILGL